MKKRILLLTCVTAISYLTLTSEKAGPATSGNNRTGAKGSPTTCGASGCHGTGAGPTVTITVDSNGTAVTHYRAGSSYKIKIHGSLTGTTNQYFGFSFTAVSGTGAAQVKAGSYGTLPGTRMAKHTFSGLEFIEHNISAIQVPVAGTYDTAFTWIAPATAGTGAITMYCTINAVNGDGSEGNADVSGNTNIILSEISNVGVNNLLNATGIKAYPNPVSDNLHIEMEHADAGNYTFTVIDLSGRTMISQAATINNGDYNTNINTGSLVKGFYLLQIANGDAQRILQIVKE